MTNVNSENNLNNIRREINLIKKRLDNLETILKTQEEAINELTKNTKALFSEAISNNSETNTMQEIIKKTFSKGQLPNILSKGN